MGFRGRSASESGRWTSPSRPPSREESSSVRREMYIPYVHIGGAALSMARDRGHFGEVANPIGGMLREENAPSWHGAESARSSAGGRGPGRSSGRVNMFKRVPPTLVSVFLPDLHIDLGAGPMVHRWKKGQVPQGLL